MPKMATQNKQKVENWHRLEKLFALAGRESLAKLEKDVYPTTFMVKVNDYKKMYDRYLSFGGVIIQKKHSFYQFIRTSTSPN